MKSHSKTIVVWGTVAGALTAILVLIGMAAAIVEENRPWPRVETFLIVAGDSYNTSIKFTQRDLDEAQLLVDKCDINKDCPDATYLRAKNRLSELQRELEKLKRNEALAGGG